MKIIISFKNINATIRKRVLISSKTKKLDKFIKGNYRAKWCFYRKNDQVCADVSLIGSHFVYHAQGQSSGFVKTLDLILEKIKKQLYKRKDKFVTKARKKEQAVILDPEQAWLDYDSAA